MGLRCREPFGFESDFLVRGVFLYRRFYVILVIDESG